MLKNVVTATVVLVAVAFGHQASAYTPAQRATIRAMPITERPYRPGHFYGNTVRFLNRVVAPAGYRPF